MSCVSSEPFCTVLGCRRGAVVIVQTSAGPRLVCGECATGQEVLKDV